MQMKFKAHQSFFVRKGWLSKGLSAVLANDAIFMPANSKEAMDELGLGKNQVIALRYWLQCAGLIALGYRNQRHRVTELGQMIHENDPYIEEIGTLWALHHNIASGATEATSWYYFFNEFRMGAFSRDDFSRSIESFIAANGDERKVALNSIEADFNCILSTYIPHDRGGSRRTSPEDVIDSPFGALGLIGRESAYAKTYRKRTPFLSALPNLLVLYAIYGMRGDCDEAQAELKLDSLVDAPLSPGRSYNLDSVSLISKLYELENEGWVRLNRTAGLDVVRLSRPGMSKEDCLAEYYRMMR